VYAANELDASLVDNVGGKRRQTRRLRDPQNRSTLETAHISFSDYELG
jgi:hypothetical protein